MTLMFPFYRRYGKRVFDLLIATPALILLSPGLAGLALLVRIKLGAPVFFRQQRPGLHGQPFTLHNYRLSNVLAAIGRGQLRVLDDRVRRKREIFAFYRHALADRHHAPPAPNFGGEGCVSPRIGG